jgi:hypothetical protein
MPLDQRQAQSLSAKLEHIIPNLLAITKTSFREKWEVPIKDLDYNIYEVKEKHCK